jgi:hypothetical protein
MFQSKPVLFVMLLAIIAGCAAPAMQMSSNRPADLDTSATHTGDNGIFRVTYLTHPAPAPLNELHAWTLHVESIDGVPVEDAVITVSGDMPEHRHGMPTRPQVTEEPGRGGDYRVEGMQFQMGGWWAVTFEIEAGEQRDRVTFNLQLK